LVLLLVVFLCVHLGATTYYVAKTGSDGNDGSYAHPWLTIGHAGTKVAAGDTVLVEQGTYSEVVTFNGSAGTAAAPIVFESYDGLSTVIFGSVYMHEPHYILRGFTVQLDSSRHIGQAIKIENSGDSCEIRNCDVYDPHEGSYSAQGILVGHRSSGVAIYGGVIDSNLVHDFGNNASQDHGIYAQGVGTKITHNVVYNNCSRNIQLYYGGGEPDIDSVEVAYNVCYGANNRGGMVLKCRYSWIHDNICYDNATHGIEFYPGAANNVLSNNVCYDNCYYGIYGEACTGSNMLKNNICLNNTWGQIEMNYPPDVVDYSCYYPDGTTEHGQFTWYDSADGHHFGGFAAWKAGTGQDAHSICADPQFVAPDSHNFRLQDTTSPCFDAGDSATTPGYDLDGVWRPQVAAADMGAYEYQTSAYDHDVGVTAIVAPTGTVDSGATITPQARVKNYGTSAASFPVTFRIGSFYSDSQNVSNLAAGDSVLVSFSTWTAVQRGTHATRCTTALTGDQNHSNDALSGSVTVRVTNVGVTAILAPTGTVDSGATITPKARVKNYGTGSATFPVTMRIGTSYTNTKTVTNLAAGDSVQVNFSNWTARPRGLLAVRCSTALSGDQNHTNDTLSGTVMVRVTDVGVTAIVAPAGTVDSGTVVTPQARVKNYGTGSATFPVTFRIGASYTNTQTVSNLAAGDSVLVSFSSWTAGQRGTYATRCTTALTGDQVHSNDAKSGSVTVRVTNVGVTAIVAPTGTVDSGATVTPKARVKNYGTGAATFPVTFRIGTIYTNTQTVSNLAAGDSVQVSFTDWTAGQRGTYATRCSTALTGDQVHSNDTLSGSVTVRVTNVGVTAIVAPPDTVDSGATITPQARVKNYGTSAATFPATFRIGTSYTNTQTISNLAAGDSVLVSFSSWTAGQRGSFVKRCSTALTGDQNHTNDTLSGTVTVVAAPVIDVGVTAILAPTGTVDSGATVTPKARVKNCGTSAATFPAIFRIGTSYTNTQTVSNLAAGDSVQVSFTDWTAGQRGTYATRCSTALTGDQVHSNDTLSGSVTVRVTNVGVTAIVAPIDTVDSGATITPQAWVWNYGNTAATFPVKLNIGTGGAVEKLRLRVDVGPRAEASVRNLRSSATSTGVILSTTPMERTQALFHQPLGYTDTQTVTNLAPGDSVEVSFASWTAAPRGLLAVSCSTGLAGDQNHGNDTLSSSVMVRVKDIGVVGINKPAGTYELGEIVTPTATVRNYGNVPVGFEVWMLLTDPTGAPYYSDSTSVANLDPRNNVLVNTFRPCTLRLLGDWTVKCSTALSGDTHLENNVMTGPFKTRSQWVEMKSMPLPPSYRPVKDGAWLAYDAGSGLVYAGKGNKTSDFYSYNIPDNDWTSLRAIPPGLEAKLPRQGACGVGDGSGYIYMAKGNNTLGFWRYDIATDSWLQLSDVPVGSHRRVKGGSGAVYVQIGDSGFVYLLKGPTCEFYRFNVATGTWETMQSAPAGSHSKWYDGSFLTFDGDHAIYAHKARYHELWAYDVLTATWSSTQRNGMPFVGRSSRSRKSRGGGAAAWFEGGIYALKGGSTSEFWRYAATADTWAEFDELPPLGSSGNRKVSTGGCIVSVDDTLFALKGDNTNEFWRYALVSLKVPQPSREGIMAERVAIGEWRMVISPNPLASGFAAVRCNLPKGGSATLEVFNASGRLVQSPIAIRNSPFQMDFRSMPAGVYLVKVTTEGFSTTQKLVVEH
jgi:hypothetical protein